MANNIETGVSPIGGLNFTAPDFTGDRVTVIAQLDNLISELEDALVVVNNVDPIDFTKNILLGVTQPLPTIRLYDPVLASSIVHSPFALNVPELQKIGNTYRIPSVPTEETMLEGLIPEWPDYDLPTFQEPDEIKYETEPPVSYPPEENPANTFNPDYTTVPNDATNEITYTSPVTTVVPSGSGEPVPTYDTDGNPIGYVDPYITPEYDEYGEQVSGDSTISYVDGWFIPDSEIDNVLDRAEQEVNDPYIVLDPDTFIQYFGDTTGQAVADELGKEDWAMVTGDTSKIVVKFPNTIWNTPVNELTIGLITPEQVFSVLKTGATIGLGAAVGVAAYSMIARASTLAFEADTTLGSTALLMFPMKGMTGTNYNYSEFINSPINWCMLADLKHFVNPADDESVNAFIQRWADIVEYDEYMNVVYKGTNVVILRRASKYIILSNEPIDRVPSEQFSIESPAFGYTTE